MTIVVGVATPDGIVMAADSRTTTFVDGAAADVATPRHRTLSDSADKLFDICDRFAVAAYGDAFIGHKTIGGVMDEFIARHVDIPPETIEELAGELGSFFHERYVSWRESLGKPWASEEGPRVGFLVAGYDADGIGHLKEVWIPGPDHRDTGIETSQTGLAYRGQTDVIHRLLAGVDWDAVAASALEFPEGVVRELTTFEYDLLFPITLQDGIDFATFLIQTTIDMQRFSDGRRGGPGSPPACGGPIRVLAVKRSEVEPVNPASLRTGRRSAWPDEAGE